MKTHVKAVAVASAVFFLFAPLLWRFWEEYITLGRLPNMYMLQIARLSLFCLYGLVSMAAGNILLAHKENPSVKFFMSCFSLTFLGLILLGFSELPLSSFLLYYGLMPWYGYAMFFYGTIFVISLFKQKE